MPAVTGIAAAVLWVALRRLPEPEREPVTGSPLRSIGTVLRHRWALAVLTLVFVEGVVVLGVLTYMAPAVQALGSSAAVAGLVAAAFGVGALVLSRVVRRLVGRLSAAGLAAVGAAMLVAGWAVPALAVSLVTVTAAGVLLGGSWAFLHSTLQSWATEVVPGERATTVALFAALLFLGGSVGTAALAPLADAGAFETVFRVALARVRAAGGRGRAGPPPLRRPRAPSALPPSRSDRTLAHGSRERQELWTSRTRSPWSPGVHRGWGSPPSRRCAGRAPRW